RSWVHRRMMKTTRFLPLLLVASRLAAQQPAATPAPQPPTRIRLDAIVGVVGDQAITRYELREAQLSKIQRKEVDEPKDSAAMLALDTLVLNDMIQEELIIQKAK